MLVGLVGKHEKGDGIIRITFALRIVCRIKRIGLRLKLRSDHCLTSVMAVMY